MSGVKIDFAELRYSVPSGGMIQGVMYRVNAERRPKKARIPVSLLVKRDAPSTFTGLFLIRFPDLGFLAIGKYYRNT